MAKRTAPSNERANLRAARDDNSVINAAVAATEQEIIDAAMDDDPLELDGDRSLEEMGDDLEGEDDIRDAEAATGDEDDGEDEGEDDDGDEDDGADAGDLEGEVTDEGDDDEAAIAAQDRQNGRGQIPPGRLREESERARAAEVALAERDQRIAELAGRVDTLTQLATRGQQQPQQQPAPVVDNFPATPPDAYADYDANQAWHVENTRRQVERATREAFQALRQETQEQANARANEAFQTAATGERSYEFHAAYDALLAMPRTSPADAAKTARTIMSAQDPAAALFDWWEEHGGPEYREQVAVRLAEQMGWEMPEVPAPQRNGRANGNGRGQPQQQQRGNQPQNGERRPVFRGPVRATRSLNDGGGSNRQQFDPRSTDDSDAAVMDYALEP